MIDFLVAVLPVFLASVVECVEAWTVVVAVGLTRGWRAPLLGVAVASVVIGVLLLIFGVTLVDRIDEEVFELIIGTLLVLFGLRWMRKAILRSIGVLAHNDEDADFRRTVTELEADGQRGPFDWLGFSIATKAMLLEGLEITFLVLTLGASGDASYPVAVTGAAAAFVVVGVAGFAARGPLSRVPQNAMKMLVAIMLVTFGGFWVAEGLGVDWAGGAWALLYLLVFWVVFVQVIVLVGRTKFVAPVGSVTPVAAGRDGRSGGAGGTVGGS
ncbi:MAG: hypothetical protein AAF531_08955 [Actinomycetota bacterium]